MRGTTGTIGTGSDKTLPWAAQSYKTPPATFSPPRRVFFPVIRIGFPLSKSSLTCDHFVQSVGLSVGSAWETLHSPRSIKYFFPKSYFVELKMQ